MNNSVLARDSQAPARLTQVQQEVERSAKLTESIEQRLNALDMRLQPILRDCPPNGQSGAEKTVGPSLVGHALSLSNHNGQLAMIENTLADILDRLEL